MIASILVGLVAGWLAGKLIRGRGYGVLADIFLGLIGGVVGGWMFAAFGVHAHHLFGAIMISTLGATALVMGTRALTGEL
ncbi:MAG: GlsB/YeaQ/YmgE family stress response membrane protein [Candidatus Binataceae bacterium]